MKLGIIGCGAYAIALASLLEKKDIRITMWTKLESEYQELKKNHTNLQSLNYKLDETVEFTQSLETLTKESDAIIIAIPTKFINDTILEMKPYYKEQELLIATKGMEQKENILLHEYLEKELKTDKIACISGPSFASDIILKTPIGFTIASKNQKSLYYFKNLFQKEKPKEKEEEKMLLTIDQLYNINNNLNKADCEYYINALNRVLPLYGINTPLRLAHFLAQVLHESGHLKYKSENLNYSAQALLKVFPKYFKTTADANAYARQPVKIANRVYANRMGNGNEASGEGWKYRGRGLLQITGRSNYEQCGKYINSDLMHYPDSILGDPDLNVKVACWYWTTRNLNQFADNDDIVTITKKINGGLNGLQDRTTVLQKAKLILNC